MTLKGTLKSKVSYRIKRSKDSVFLRENFKDIGGYDQIGRILRELIEDGLLVSLGYGVYARTKKSRINNHLIPEKPLQELAKDVIRKLGMKSLPSSAERAYNEGRTTQVPTGRVIGIKGRIARKIGYNGNYVSFEQCTG